MQRILHYLLGLVVLCVPAVCHADKVTVWDLQNQTQIEGWNTVNLTSTQLIPDGLYITTTTPGQVVKVSNLTHHVDTVAISYTSPTGGEGVFIWRAPGMDEDQVYQIPITFAAGPADQKLVLDMSRIPEWDSASDRIGFVINAGVTMTLQKMEFSGPSSFNALVYPLKTFFRFDEARAYSVNFLWGPLMTYSEHQYNALFTAFPPSADSWNTVFYWVLGIGCVCMLWKKRKYGHKAIVVFFLLVSVLWVLYDARMGAEILSYAKKDVDTWWSQPYERKVYRDRASFAAFADLATEYTEGEDSYVFIASHGWPFWSTILYTNYPALPKQLDAATNESVWLIYNRPDISQNEEGRLVINGEPISPPGDIMLPFETGSFIFLTR